MGDVRDYAERLLGANSTVDTEHPFTTILGLEQYAEGMAFVSSFANVTAFDTTEGMVVIDTSGPLGAEMVRKLLHDWSPSPVHTAVYTHGHLDHVSGVDALERKVEDGPKIRVVAHEAIVARFDRYARTAGYNAHINARQFRLPAFTWPTEYRQPDLTYRDALTLEIGGVRFELEHARGETDDHTWIWVPQHRAVCTGDLFIWAAPNCGNPQKVQRYPNEWAKALRRMASLDAVVMFPGHGPPIEGEERVRIALEDTAALLEHLHDETVSRMNRGRSLDRILAEVKAPPHLMARPWLRPIYDEPEFVVRNVWRLYGGWWDGNPARLKPPRDAQLAAEVAALSGGAARLAERASALSKAGDHALACQLVEWARDAAPMEQEITERRAEIYQRRADQETSLMAVSIYNDAAEEKK